MKRVEDGDLVYYQFDILSSLPRLAHGVFTRHGGISPPPQDGLNMGFVPQDEEANVLANMDRAARCLGINSVSFVWQVHGHRALVVRAQDGYRPRRPSEVRRGFDAMITPDPGVGLLIRLADCQGVLLHDPLTEVTAVVHSGWRGSIVDILGRTVLKLKTEFEVRPEDLIAGIGPSLGPCCAEFMNYRTELPEHFWDYRQGDHFDFWAISRDQLTAAGVKPENVEVAGLCTKCTGHEFYSYRREKITGRFGLLAGRLNGDRVE